MGGSAIVGWRCGGDGGGVGDGETGGSHGGGETAGEEGEEAENSLSKSGIRPKEETRAPRHDMPSPKSRSNELTSSTRPTTNILESDLLAAGDDEDGKRTRGVTCRERLSEKLARKKEVKSIRETAYLS